MNEKSISISKEAFNSISFENQKNIFSSIIDNIIAYHIFDFENGKILYSHLNDEDIRIFIDLFIQERIYDLGMENVYSYLFEGGDRKKFLKNTKFDLVKKELLEKKKYVSVFKRIENQRAIFIEIIFLYTVYNEKPAFMMILRDVTSIMIEREIERENMFRYRETMLSSAIQFIAVNLTQNAMLEIIVPARKEISLGYFLKMGFIKSNSYDEIIDFWVRTVTADEETVKHFQRERMLSSYFKGIRKYSEIFQTVNLMGKPIYCRQEVVMNRNELTGDIIATIIDYDDTEKIEKEKMYEWQKEKEKLSLKALRETVIIVCNVNLSRGEIIEGSMRKFGTSIESVFFNLGLPQDCTYTEFFNFWYDKVDKEYKEKFKNFFEQELLLKEYEKGVYEKNILYKVNLPPNKCIWVKHTIVLQKGKKKDDVLAYSYAVDVSSEMFELEEQKKKIKEVEEATHAKSTFLFNMSHDIRTPMNAIVGFTEIAERSLDNTPKMKDCLEKIRLASNTLLNLINKVLDLARIESGKESVDLTIESVYEIENTCRAIFVPEMEQKSINYSFITDVENEYYYIDKMKIVQIVINLLGNAIKFTPQNGTISSVLRQIEPPDENGFVLLELSIKDSGIGMSEEFLQRAFEAFERERSSTESGIEGTGLGLAIVKKMCDLMGATLNIKSEIGEGTEFILQCRLKIGSPTKKEKRDLSVKENELFGLRVLVVEDNKLNSEIAYELLTDMGITVEIAENGAIAIEKVMKSNRLYDCIFMDIQMPVMDGYRATHEIRNLKGDAGKTPILAMTANAFDEDRAKALSVGMDGHISKPIERDEIVRSILEVIKKE